MKERIFLFLSLLVSIQALMAQQVEREEVLVEIFTGTW